MLLTIWVLIRNVFLFERKGSARTTATVFPVFQFSFDLRVECNNSWHQCFHELYHFHQTDNWIWNMDQERGDRFRIVNCMYVGVYFHSNALGGQLWGLTLDGKSRRYPLLEYSQRETRLVLRYWVSTQYFFIGYLLLPAGETPARPLNTANT